MRDLLLSYESVDLLDVIVLDLDVVSFSTLSLATPNTAPLTATDLQPDLEGLPPPHLIPAPL